MSVSDPSPIEAPQPIKGLTAAGPCPGMEKELRLFGQFVGGWEIHSRWFLEDGTTREGTGEVHYGWVLDGRVIQDVWLSHQGSPPRAVPAGTTLRFFDPGSGGWRCVWIDSRNGFLQVFVARAVGDQIVLEGLSRAGNPERWIYSEITESTFRWRSIESADGGKTWRITQQMSMTRLRGDGGAGTGIPLQGR